MSARAAKVNESVKQIVQIIQVKGNLAWKWGRARHGDYVAICDPFAQTVQAKKFSDLLAAIDEALDSTFRELLSTGDLDKFLQERGWTAELPAKTKKNVRFDMPFDLKGASKRDLQEAVC